MGKKFKSGTKQTPAGKQENGANNGTAVHMGISEKSKKIKKQKNRENLTKLKEAVETEATVQPAVMKEKKKKGKKHKTPTVDESSVERKPGVEVNGNGSAVVASKKSKKDKLEAAEEVKLEHGEQGQKKKHKKNKAPVEDKPEVSAVGTKPDAVSKKSKKKKKRKGPEVETEVDQPKKHKKNKDSVTVGSAEANGTEETVSKKEKRNAPPVVKAEVPGDKPHKKHKKKNKHKNQPNGAAQPTGTEPETKAAKHNKKQQQEKAIEADKDVVTSESESEGEQNDASNEMDKVNQRILSQHSKSDEDESSGDEQPDDKKPKDEKADEEKKKRRFTGPEHSIFIGNLPNTAKKSTMKTMFKQYGQIQTIRFRSNDGITLFKKKDWKEAKALNCYIRFETRKEAEAACAANGQLVEGNRIRVTIHTQKQMGHVASTVFVGNISHKTTDNELYDFFSRVGEIEYVRQIADRGIGYVCFKKGVSIAKALKLNQQLLNGRPLRIMKADPAKQGKRKNKKGNLVDKAKFARPGGPAKQPTAGQKEDRPGGGQKQKPTVREFHGAMAKTKSDNRHKHKKKGGSDQKKKLLAQKLTAAGASRKK